MPWLIPIAAFLIGSIPFGILIAKARGIDIRSHGSGNIGATNVFRIVGKGPGMLCFLLDFLKGFVPVVLATNLARVEGAPPAVPLPFLWELGSTWPATQQLGIQTMQVVTAMATILGHNYSPWIGFRGGKGIATSAGAITGLMPLVFISMLALFSVTLAVTRYVSVGSLVAALTLPVFTYLAARLRHVNGDPQQPTHWDAGTWNKPLMIFAIVTCSLAFWRHRTNLARLRAGTEVPLFGTGKSKSDEL